MRAADFGKSPSLKVIECLEIGSRVCRERKIVIFQEQYIFCDYLVIVSS